MDHFIGSSWGGIVAAAFILVGLVVGIAIWIADPTAPGKEAWRSYEARLDHYTRFLFMPPKGRATAFSATSTCSSGC